MKNKYKKKVWLNWLHLIIVILGIASYSYIIKKLCMNVCGLNVPCPQPTFLECLLDNLSSFPSLLIIIIGLALLYLITTLISWLYYSNKK